jgi:NADPH-dependent curcumin reductase CurA
VVTLNRSWVLAHRPEGAVRTSDFAYREEAFDPPTLQEGEILIHTQIISCAPTIRNWLNPPGRSYRGAIGIGEPIRGMAAVEVMASRHASFAVGQWLTAVAPWQDYAVLRPDAAAVPVKAIEEGIDPVDAMTLFSPNSLTAYFGLWCARWPVSRAAGSLRWPAARTNVVGWKKRSGRKSRSTIARRTFRRLWRMPVPAA